MMNKKKHPLYYTWNGMMYRCYKPYHSHYKYYGAKGYSVCERWHNFSHFVEDINNHMPNGHLLYKKEYVIDKDLKDSKIYSLTICTIIRGKFNSDIARLKQKKKVIAEKNTKVDVFESLAEVSTLLQIQRSSIISCIKRGNRHKSGYKFVYADT